MEKYLDFEAYHRAKGFVVRIVKINDITLTVEMDFRLNRINAEVELPNLKIPETMNKFELQSYLWNLQDTKEFIVVRSYSDEHYLNLFR